MIRIEDCAHDTHRSHGRVRCRKCGAIWKIDIEGARWVAGLTEQEIDRRHNLGEHEIEE
jgi:hypothetical protein